VFVMINSIFGKKKKKSKPILLDGVIKSSTKLTKPTKELNRNTVSSKRFNEMIDFYTHELKTRLDELESVRTQNEIILKTALKQGSQNDERTRELLKLREENRLLKEKTK